MNTLPDSQTPPTAELQCRIESYEHVSESQQQIIKDFFLKDSGPEMIESLHMLVESYLFTENLVSVTSEMREHIVNQLRVATLIAKLDAGNICVSKSVL